MWRRKQLSCRESGSKCEFNVVHDLFFPQTTFSFPVRLRLFPQASQRFSEHRIMETKRFLQRCLWPKVQLQAQYITAGRQGAVRPLRNGYRLVFALDKPKALQGRRRRQDPMGSNRRTRPGPT